MSTGGGPGRRLRAAARPSLGLALTAMGLLVGVGAILLQRSEGDPPEGPKVRVCRTEAVRATVRRQARSRQVHVARRPISSRASVTATEATADGGKVTVTATANGRRTLLVRAEVTAGGNGAVTVTERTRACALDSDRDEGAFRASIEAKRRGQARAERRVGAEARRRARRDAVRRGQASARRSAQVKLDRSEPEEQAQLDEATREDARRKAREDAKAEAAAAI